MIKHTAKARTSFQRLIPKLEGRFKEDLDPATWAGFRHRLEDHFPQLFEEYFQLYGGEYDFFFHLESLLEMATRMWLQRPDDLKALDAARDQDPRWFESNRMVGAMCYVDLFADDLDGLFHKIPYLTDLSITYLHLMPMFRSPEGDDDGGYAVSSYRELNADFGTVQRLRELSQELRRHGISLCLDFILNHTSDEHDWALKAIDGEEEYQAFYHMFTNRKEPDAYEATIPPIFPDEHPGSFTYRSRIRRWVWTSFHNYQWDLNYANPAVFTQMAEEMLFLANLGTEVLRLDAVAFLWKRMGTNCQNQPEVHHIIRALNVITRIVSPAMVFKSEAIVHPDEVATYISPQECQLSYNPQLMSLLWNALATRETKLLRYAVQKRLAVPENCSWVNYIRCHDDIGWGMADEDMLDLDMDPHGHRHFLGQFYTNRFDGSFARGLPFQEDPNTGHIRVSGTCASLVGMEQAVLEDDARESVLATRRLLLLHSIIMTIGGIPLLYLGDELGMLNDYAYTEDTEKDGDSRWAHRPAFDWQQAEQRLQPETLVGRIYRSIQRLIQIRQRNPAFSGVETEIVDLSNDHVFGYFRHHDQHSALVLANFTEHDQVIAGNRLRQLGMRKTATDTVSGQFIVATRELILEPYQFMVLVGGR
uniref:GH13: Amylosucrase n=1 Tax=Magnetococcus massalia (strain MO-1) TaxID=451514 RepID=A0A1S7LK28_MAGMO|nr:GH13 : Amylosucrase [Candidatus Magnetococcus massalia]